MANSHSEVGANRLRVAAVQASPRPFQLDESVEIARMRIAEAGAGGAGCIVFPEAFLGGYLKGFDFGARMGSRTAEGREWFQRYFAASVEVGDASMLAIGEAAAQAKAYVVMSFIEREGGTMYCSVGYFGPDGQFLGRRRKLMPTAIERLVWGCGDGSTLAPLQTPFGKVNAAICWENYMPQLRLAMYGKGVDLWCAPTVDDRENWQATMRHIACEGRCFVVSSVQVLGRHHFPADAPIANDAAATIRGGSVIYGPLGEQLAGPVYDEETILYADLHAEAVAQARFDFDAVGHYSRPDIFRLEVDERPKPAVLTQKHPD